jgi:hypothetical protein
MHSPTNGSNYIAYTDLKTYAQADTFCKSKQGHLAVINNVNEHNEVMKYLDSVNSTAFVQDYWGGEYKLGANPYQTATGQAFYNMGWVSSSPDDVLNFYMTYRVDPKIPLFGVYWYAYGTDLFPFVCEFEDSAI